MSGSAQDEYKVYFARCPRNFPHWILIDPSEPRFRNENVPRVEYCRGCGDRQEVTIETPLKIGWVTSDERDKLFSLEEPRVQRS